MSKEGPGVWRLSGKSIERMVIQTDWDNDESIIYLQHRLDRLGIERELLKEGARNGDVVRILGYELEFTGVDDDTSDVLSEDAAEELDWEESDAPADGCDVDEPDGE